MLSIAERRQTKMPVGELKGKMAADVSDLSRARRRWPLSCKNSMDDDQGRPGAKSAIQKNPASLPEKGKDKPSNLAGRIAALKKQTQKTAFKVAIPNRVPTPLQEANSDLSTLTTTIDHMLQVRPEGVVDIDTDCGQFYSPTYADHIVAYLKEREAKYLLPSALLHKSTAIKHSSRSVLVDWLIQVQEHLELETESLHLTLALLDQMLAVRPVSVAKVQLIGIVCLLIASKVVERFPPKMSALLRLTENAYTVAEMKAAERLVLKTLKFDIVLPTPVTFLDRCIKASAHELSKETLLTIHRMSAYLLELAFTDHRLMVRPPSERASAAVCLARMLLLPPEMSPWSRTLAHYSTYQEGQLEPLVSRLATLLLRKDSSKFRGATRKYRRTSYAMTSTHSALANLDLLRQLAHSTADMVPVKRMLTYAAARPTEL